MQQLHNNVLTNKYFIYKTFIRTTIFTNKLAFILYFS